MLLSHFTFARASHDSSHVNPLRLRVWRTFQRPIIESDVATDGQRQRDAPISATVTAYPLTTLLRIVAAQYSRSS
jgi:hypothetical protein